MAKKTIAAVLLITMAVWSEMALAPMLAMHAGHMRPGQETAADMPAHHTGHHHTPQSAKAAGLPCCPGLHKAEPDAELMIVADAPSCDDPHSCCFRQGPQSVPAPARDAQNLVREIAPAVRLVAIPVRESSRIHPRDSALDLIPPADAFGMTLRI